MHIAGAQQTHVEHGCSLSCWCVGAAAAAAQSMLEFLRGICSDVKVVQGDFDDFESPEHLVSSSSSSNYDLVSAGAACYVLGQLFSKWLQHICIPSGALMRGCAASVLRELTVNSSSTNWDRVSARRACISLLQWSNWDRQVLRSLTPPLLVLAHAWHGRTVAAAYSCAHISCTAPQVVELARFRRMPQAPGGALLARAYGCFAHNCQPTLNLCTTSFLPLINPKPCRWWSWQA